MCFSPVGSNGRDVTRYFSYATREYAKGKLLNPLQSRPVNVDDAGISRRWRR
jgi:hypothetical protein